MSGSLMDDDRSQAVAFVEQATGMPIQQYAFNSAVTSASATEILSVISFGQRPLALLIMSPVMAKTLATSLFERVREYEEMTQTQVKTITEIASDKLSRSSE